MALRLAECDSKSYPRLRRLGHNGFDDAILRLSNVTGAEWNAMRRQWVAIILSIAVALFSAGFGMAQAQTPAAFSTPTQQPPPPRDALRVQVYGDGMAEGLLVGLLDAFAAEPRFQIQRRHRAIRGLLRGNAEDDARAIEGEIAKEPPQIAILMLGVADRVPLNTWDEVGSEEWRTEYGRRMDRLMRVLRGKGATVYWVGLPIMRRANVADDAQMMSGVMRERALANSVRFIDMATSFAEADGSYNVNGPDITGKTRVLREPDGVHFTPAGYRKLAHFVEREIKRDIAQARTERSVPLAGNEEEQRKIRPQQVSVAGGSGDAAAATPGPGGGARAGARVSPTDGANSGEIRADNSRVTIKSADGQGKVEAVTLEILRPAIPASVVALVTRRESADRPSFVGDAIMTEVVGGVTLVSSITPSGDAAGGDRRRQSTVNSMYFQVLIKGERLEPRPGRSDDLPWPRQEVLPPQPPAPAVRTPSSSPSAAIPRPPPNRAARPTPAPAPREQKW